MTQARAQPSRLLLARHQVVPFTGREHILDRLAAWTGADEPVAVLLVHGAGGQGKTRLAAQVGVECKAADWTIWQVTHTATPVAGTSAVSRVELHGGAVLAIVDYADRWPPSALMALLSQLRELNVRAGTRVRVLTLARSTKYWWPTLADRVEAELDITSDELALPSLATDQHDLFAVAAARFAEALGIKQASWGSPLNLEDPEFSQILAVHMAALAYVDAHRHGDQPPTEPHAISSYLLRRESTYWHLLHSRIEDPLSTPPRVMHRTTYTATLTGALPRAGGHAALKVLGLAATTAAADTIIDDHRLLYPPLDLDTALEALHPDRLGEDLIALSTPGHNYTDAIAVTLVDDWTLNAPHMLSIAGMEKLTGVSSAIAVLTEVAYRWPHIAKKVLYPLLRNRPDLAIAAGGTALIRLAHLPDVDITILSAVDDQLPTRRDIDLDAAAAAISSVLIDSHLADAAEPAEQARLLARHSWRLANAGYREEALSPAAHATSIYRQLAKTNVEVYLPELAGSVVNLGSCMFEVGRLEDALAITGHASALYRELVANNPGLYLPGLATSLNNLCAILTRLGRLSDALQPAEEAARIYWGLAEADPSFLPDLIGLLGNVSQMSMMQGNASEALSIARQIIRAYRLLAENDPDSHLPNLAHSLTVYVAACEMYDCNWVEARDLIQEAIQLYERLAERLPHAFNDSVWAAYHSYANILDALGEASAAAEVRWQLYSSNDDDSDELGR
ncbi:tetratricopeptide repeat protein [Actinoplanes sp. NPDC020271]|uniref:tetratricopeptide repeat protein n=1 Tax=Actinoplanes sp. NPDC020271 TaxID=3363896 RepID=UPI00379368B6